MLLEFKVKNFKTFNNEIVFSMMPAPKQKGLDYSILKEELNGKPIKGLSSSVIYGPNAAGKTNIISAIEVFKAIILRGHIKNDFDGKKPNVSQYILELIPNADKKNSKPVEFSIDFTENKKRFKYILHIDLGKFLDKEYERKILLEELYVNNKLIYTRTDKLNLSDNVKIITDKDIFSKTNNVIDLLENTLKEDALFLSNGFKLIVSNETYETIENWLKNKLEIYRADTLDLRPTNYKNGVLTIDELNRAAKIFGAQYNDIGYISDGESEPFLCSIIKNGKKERVIPADDFESYGTIRFTNIFPLLHNAIKNGGTLVIDEFDASIHPIALINIVNIFHNDEINTKNAQLIFNTHNPIFLNSNIFRRDEIKFVERNEDKNSSELYSLSDFGTSGAGAVRKDSDYMKNYFIDRYGAIKEIDFSPLFSQE